ncbi:glycoside hydrolase family 25 protein [Pontibacter arcticus]|uniref:Lysozyme n=1 Tax=Pontibacter arcticus TaxID=2080288 RepID=A0A364RIQ6_9BACT|nr:GH25 family lysozyme [Pontibacter arcticus]RAU84220.1 lysozyme [Pontibacter arcticus]
MAQFLSSFSRALVLCSAVFTLSIASTSVVSAGGAGNTPNNSTDLKTNTTTTIKGIDVSRWQKEVDWALVKEAEISFAFVKATQADFRLDPYFARNWEETKRHGIKRGAYHFYKPEAPIQGQIDLFINTVSLEPGDLPPVLDIEVFDKNISSEKMRQDIKLWLEAITAHYGVKPIIYTYQNYYRRYLQGHFPEYHFWIARYSPAQPEVHHTDKWMFWQYTDRGTIAGINSAVDINFFAGDLDSLGQLCLPEFTASDALSPLKQLKHMHPLQ